MNERIIFLINLKNIAKEPKYKKRSTWLGENKYENQGKDNMMPSSFKLINPSLKKNNTKKITLTLPFTKKYTRLIWGHL